MRLGQPVVLAAVAEGVAREGQLQHLHELGELGHRLCQVLAEALELVGLIAAADAEHQAAVGQRIDHADLGDQPHGLVERRHHHRGAEPDAARLAGQPRQHHQRRGAHAVVGEMMLGKPGDLEAIGLRRLHLLDGVVVELVGLGAGRAISHQVELAEMHGKPLLAISAHSAMRAPPHSSADFGLRRQPPRSYHRAV